jgi:hypothetical protein
MQVWFCPPEACDDHPAASAAHHQRPSPITSRFGPAAVRFSCLQRPPGTTRAGHGGSLRLYPRSGSACWRQRLRLVHERALGGTDDCGLDRRGHARDRRASTKRLLLFVITMLGRGHSQWVGSEARCWCGVGSGGGNRTVWRRPRSLFPSGLCCQSGAAVGSSGRRSHSRSGLPVI